MSENPNANARPNAFRRNLFAMLGLCFVIMLVALDQTIVGTALPTIVAELKGFELYAWVATAYLLASVMTVPIFGRLGDYYGRKYFVLASIGIFTLSSMLCGMAGSMLQLVLARGLQGAGGGMLVGTVFACVTDLFPDIRQRLRWRVMISSSFGISNAIGPSLGGFLTQYYGWRSVFYVNLPIGLLAVWWVWRHMPRIRHMQTQGPIKLDWQGALLIAAGLGCLQLLVEMAPRDGVTPLTLGLAGACAAALGATLWWERRVAHPILPLQIFRDRALAVLFALSAFGGLLIFALTFYTPLLLQGGLGLTPEAAGMLVTPLVVFVTVASITNSRVITRLPDPAWMMRGGFLVLILACAALTTVDAATPHWLIVAILAFAGLGFGFMNPNIIIITQEVADRSQMGIVTAMSQTMRMVGGMAGTAGVGALVSRFYETGLRGRLAGAGGDWWRLLADPQVLVNRARQIALAQAHPDAAQYLAAARRALVAAIHAGDGLPILISVVGFWLVGRVPRVNLSRRAPKAGAAD